jgi:signal transduction histidine kinase
MGPGTHVIAVQGFNDSDYAAGLIVGLRITFTDGKSMKVFSDRSWRIASLNDKDWMTRVQAPQHWGRANALGPMGVAPWGFPLRISLAPTVRPLELRFWQKGWFQISVSAVGGIIVVLCVWLAARLAFESKAQKLLQVERARIARDIHDDLGSGLTELVLLGEVAQRSLTQEPGACGPIRRVCEKGRRLSHIIDEVVWAVNSNRDTVADFVTYVCQSARVFTEATEMRCRWDVESDLPASGFDLPLRRNLFLAVKEAINNSAKHSGGLELNLRIRQWGDGLLVVVEDDGAGFDPVSINDNRNGLENMAARMAEIGGDFRIESEPGKGCKVEFRLPHLCAPRAPRLFRGGKGSKKARTPSAIPTNNLRD